MPDYIDSVLDEQQLPPPYSFPDVRFNAFLLSASFSALQKYCDTYLNIGRNGDNPFFYRPLFPFVYLCVLDYPKLYSDFGKFADWGYVSQREVFIMFPLMRYEAPVEHNIMLGHELSWACPFIAVDSSTSAFTGREVLGFQKAFGQITMAEDADHCFSADVALPAFKVFNRETPQELLPLIRVRTGGTEADTHVSLDSHDFPWSALRHADVTLHLDGDARALWDPIESSGILSVTNLKQFRDGENQLKAVYQALIGTEFTFSNFSQPEIHTDAVITIFDNATLPLVETLGLLGGTPSTGPEGGIEFKSWQSLGLTADLAVTKVRNIYTSPSDPSPPTPPPGPCDALYALWFRLLDEFDRLMP